LKIQSFSCARYVFRNFAGPDIFAKKKLAGFDAIASQETAAYGRGKIVFGSLPLSASQLMVKLKIIINCGPCEPYIAQCIDSLRQQSYADWEAYVTVDGCKDRTYENAVHSCGADRRLRITRNPQRMFSLWNLIQAIRSSNAAPEDVIVSLDGDDWLARTDALEIIAGVYSQHYCWVTYGSWISNVTDENCRPRGMWPAYPDGTSDFRKIRWLATAIRTWKKWLWDRVEDRDLRDPTGAYYRVSEDQAVMLPLLEMSSTDKARHIPEALMVYNQQNPYAAGLTMAEEMLRNAIHLERQRPYKRLLAAAAFPLETEENCKNHVLNS
jgi:glycosyltransferase involved in cell wall biosynthesis